MIYTLNPDYQHVKPLLTEIEGYYRQSSRIIHAARNEIRIVSFENTDFAIKSFKAPGLINQFIYTFLRHSKARRSYDYSLKIGNKRCPEAIACIEERKNILLRNSYYISRYHAYDFTIRPVLVELDFTNRAEILKAFAEFTYELHQNNILHKDYSPGNILVNEIDGRYSFKIVDVNRMQFKQLTLKDRLQNFARFNIDDASLKIIMNRYAKLMQKPEQALLQQAIQYRDRFISRRKLKNKLRGRG